MKNPMKTLMRTLCLMLVLAMLGGAASAVELKKGSKGVDTVYLQLRLNHLGYDVGTPDGDYGGKTAKAVSAFQQDHGLEATGAVDEATWEALFDETTPLKLSVGSGFDSKTYQISYNMPAPFTTMEVSKNKYEMEDMVKLEVDGLMGYAYLDTFTTLEDYEQKQREELKNTFDNTFVAQYQGSDYEVSDSEQFEINGKPAFCFSSHWNFVNGGKIEHFFYAGAMELDEFNGEKTLLCAMIAYNLNAGMSELLGRDELKAIMAGARCDRDRIFEYQAGAADRMAAAGVTVDVPEFLPLDDGTSVGDAAYAIQKYVDPAADGSSGQLDGKTCVSMYYGAKLMDWYVRMVNAGNSASNVLQEARMSLSVAAMDFDLMHAFPEVKEQYRAAFSAARLALDGSNAPYLAAMGIDSPAWTEDDLSAMNDALMGVFDAFIAEINKSE